MEIEIKDLVCGGPVADEAAEETLHALLCYNMVRSIQV